MVKLQFVRKGTVICKLDVTQDIVPRVGDNVIVPDERGELKTYEIPLTLDAVVSKVEFNFVKSLILIHIEG